MQWCAGFSRAFWDGYHEIIPKAPGTLPRILAVHRASCSIMQIASWLHILAVAVIGKEQTIKQQRTYVQCRYPALKFSEYAQQVLRTVCNCTSCIIISITTTSSEEDTEAQLKASYSSW